MSTYSDIQQQLVTLRTKVKDIVDPHLSIRGDDEQYDDPELWWAQPLLDDLEQALSNMQSNG